VATAANGTRFTLAIPPDALLHEGSASTPKAASASVRL
jgi:hypothetical protein